MDISPHRLSGPAAKALLAMVAIPAASIVALPAAPASADPTHTLSFTGSVDIKDDDVGQDDWCYTFPLNSAQTLDHGDNAKRSLPNDEMYCDEVRIVVGAKGELQRDERICNIVVDVYLYEGWTLVPHTITDLDGHKQWKGGMNVCISKGQSLVWDVIRVDNTAEDEPDHGWVRNFTLSHT